MADTNPSKDASAEASADQSQGNRRAFLKGAAVAAGAAAATGFAAQASAHSSLQQAGGDGDASDPTVLRKTGPAVMRVSFDARERVHVKHLQEALVQVLERSGCPSCGLVGLDIRLGLDDIVTVDPGLAATAVLEGGQLPG